MKYQRTCSSNPWTGGHAATVPNPNEFLFPCWWLPTEATDTTWGEEEMPFPVAKTLPDAASVVESWDVGEVEYLDWCWLGRVAARVWCWLNGEAGGPPLNGSGRLGTVECSEPGRNYNNLKTYTIYENAFFSWFINSSNILCTWWIIRNCRCRYRW